MTRRLLIDGDLLNFQCAAACEVDTQWSTWQWTRHADLELGTRMLDEKIAELKADTKADTITLALTDDVNWRKSVMASYKAHRLVDRKPVIYAALREYVHEKYDTFQRPTLEGDDVLGILATRKADAGEERVIWSIDKDLLQIPGLHWRDGELVVVTPNAGDDLHYMQTLTGDPTDGYPGCPGIGPVKAEKILDATNTHDEAWAAIVAAYSKAGLSEEVALQNARVARICRAQDYDFNKREVRLWTP